MKAEDAVKLAEVELKKMSRRRSPARHPGEPHPDPRARGRGGRRSPIASTGARASPVSSRRAPLTAQRAIATAPVAGCNDLSFAAIVKWIRR